MQKAKACRVCGGEDIRAFLTATERMFGMGGSFAYDQCGGCGGVQISEIPTDVARYYPPNYYSLQVSDGIRRVGAIRAALLRFRMRGYFDDSRIGRLLTVVRPHPSLAALSRQRPQRHARILDVGCGRGDLLRLLRDAGFTALNGIDPFLERPISEPGIRIANVALDRYDTHGRFDVVMMHHVLEHLEDPETGLARVRDLLEPGGVCVLRVPVADSLAAERYGPLWVQLDAPRHLTIPTRLGMRLLAERVGLRVADSWDDSTAFQFLGSEGYRKGFSLATMPSNGTCRWLRSVWYTAHASRLNRAHRGDQAVFVLAPAKR